jgi:4'-phosphopantetheinyl transferase
VTGPAWSMADAGDVPESDAWLGPSERTVLSGYALARRRRDWRLGRWAAKQAALAACGELDGADAAELEILAAADGAPEAWLRGAPAKLSLSISHRDGTAIALACSAGTLAGCDLELVERRAAVFAADWFTPGELAAVEGAPAASRDLLVTMVWSAKESALKAIRQGLRLDTRDVEVKPSFEKVSRGQGWRPFTAFCAGKPLGGWWRNEDRWVMTAVMDPASSPPVLMNKAWKTKERVR